MSKLEFYRDVAGQAAQFARHSQAVCQIPQQIRAQKFLAPPLLTGIATSLSAWKSAHSLISTQDRNPPDLWNTCDLLDYCFPQNRDRRPLFVMSRSGDSAEIHRLMETIAPDRVVVGITEGRQSVLADRANLLLAYRAEEKAFPNTSSFTLSQLYALAVVVGLGYEPAIPLEDLVSTLCREAEAVCQSPAPDERIGQWLAEASAILVEGQGLLTGVVEQYALDFHETRSAGIPVTGGIMRHGVVELTQQPGVVTLMLIPHDPAAPRKLRLAEELADAHKPVIVVTDGQAPSHPGVLTLSIPQAPRELQSILFTMGMQKIYGSYIRQKGLDSLQPTLVGKVTRME